MHIKNRLLTTFVAFGVSLATHGVTFAKPLTAAEVSTFLTSGQMRFVAGSIGGFNSNGTYTFQHGSSRENGTYVINSDGTVTFKASNRNVPDVFYVDSTNGNNSFVYISGSNAGKTYRLR